MTTLWIGNSHTQVSNAPREVHRTIDRVCSYMLKGAEFSPNYDPRGGWDGKIRLYAFSKKNGYRFPSGLLRDVSEALDRKGHLYRRKDLRERPEASLNDLEWNSEFFLRDYQERTVSLAVKHERGLIHLPPRSGKTVIASGLIHRLKVPTLFLVNSQILLRQSQSSISKVLGTPVGVVGDGEFNPRPITVATVQSLTRVLYPSFNRRKSVDPREALAMRKVLRVPLLLFDECHHLTADIWRQLVLDAESYYKFGLSATILLDGNVGDSDSIWLKATTGRVLYRQTIPQMVERGVLVPPKIILHKVSGDLSGSWPKPYKDGVINHVPRNTTIARIAKEETGRGESVVIVVDKVEHMKALQRVLKTFSVPHDSVWGQTSSRKRESILERFRGGQRKCLIGTVFHEAVDLPICSVVVNAAGGASEIQTVQRLRNMTKFPGKTEARTYDFADLHNEYLAEHAESRLQTYRENGFTIEVRPEAV